MSRRFPDDGIVYVVLDPALEEAEPLRFERLFNAFVDGYGQYFSGDQAESVREWKARIAGKALPQPVMRIVVAVDTTRGEQVIGGVAVEYYRHARSVLGTYLYVSEDGSYRNRGYARDLLDDARAQCRLLGDVEALFVEAEWPEALRSEGYPVTAIAKARARLRFFARLHARMLNVDYVQPTLEGGKKPVSVLRLLVVPEDGDRRRVSDHVLSAAASRFLVEFYAALEQETGEVADRMTLARLNVQLATRRPLTAPLPTLRLEDVALAFHFVEPLDGLDDGEEVLAYVREHNCPVLHSMESDLLSRAYRAQRLFRTVCLTKPVDPDAPDSEGGATVEIEFPRAVTFQSENRREARHWTVRRRTVRAYLSLTVLFDARLVVWHLTLRTDASAPHDEASRWLDEVDIITLLKLADDGADQETLRTWSGVGEREHMMFDGIAFRVAGADPVNVHGLLKAMAGIAQSRGPAPSPGPESSPRGATLEILSWDVRGQEPFCGIDDRLQRQALCGIVSGIFDFNELDDAEARDTLRPSVSIEDGLLRVHREGLVYVRRDDRAARTVARSVGISPYLIVPLATVLGNEWLLRFERLAFGRDAVSVGALSSAVELLEDALRRKWVPNPFFYPTEQELYDRALEGGVTARRGKAEEHLRDLKTRLQLAREAQRERFEAIVAGLLGAISVVSFDPLVVDLAPWLKPIADIVWLPDGRLVAHAVTLLLAAAVGLFVFFRKRPRQE